MSKVRKEKILKERNLKQVRKSVFLFASVFVVVVTLRYTGVLAYLANIAAVSQDMTLIFAFAAGVLSSVFCVSTCGALCRGCSGAKGSVAFHVIRLFSYIAVVFIGNTVTLVHPTLRGLFLILVSVVTLYVGFMLSVPKELFKGELTLLLKPYSTYKKISHCGALVSPLLGCMPLASLALVSASSGFKLGIILAVGLWLGTLPSLVLFSQIFKNTKYVTVILYSIVACVTLLRGATLVGINLEPRLPDTEKVIDVMAAYQSEDLVSAPLTRTSLPDIWVSTGKPTTVTFYTYADTGTLLTSSLYCPSKNLIIPLSIGANPVKLTFDKPGVFVYTDLLGVLTGHFIVSDENIEADTQLLNDRNNSESEERSKAVEKLRGQDLENQSTEN